jgi:AcrR family transcriptional regulator
MARRGDQLREHVLWVAKDVFLEMGFERASMDVVSARAETSKRSVYAHFESKEKLFLAVIELVRGLFLSRLRMPGDYSEQPAEALTMFCARYIEILLYEGSIQMCRISMAETARFPQGATQYFEVMFTEVHARLSVYLETIFGLSTRASAEAARSLLGQLLYPRFVRALFGVDKLAESFGENALAADFDLQPVREAVAELIKSLTKQ